MVQKLKAIFQGGAFLPHEPCDIPEGSEVELIVQGPFMLPPEIADDEQRKRILKAVAKRMQQNPIPAKAPPLTRETLHERR